MADYTLRNIPPDLHKAWKSSAALKGHSMLMYCYVALQNQIKQDIAKKGDKEIGSEPNPNVEK